MTDKELNDVWRDIRRAQQSVVLTQQIMAIGLMATFWVAFIVFAKWVW